MSAAGVSGLEAPARIESGPGALERLGDIARGLGAHALLVTGHSNRHGRASELLDGAGVRWTRFAVVTPSGRTLPVLMCGIADSTVENATETSPEMRLIETIPKPLNSTWGMSTPALSLKNSAVMCGLVPMPGEPIIN